MYQHMTDQCTISISTLTVGFLTAIAYIIYTSICDTEKEPKAVATPLPRKTRFESCVEALIFHDEDGNGRVDVDTLEELLEIMEQYEHDNLVDLQIVTYLLRDRSQTSETQDIAFQWLYVARQVWMHSPRTIMFPLDHGLDLDQFRGVAEDVEEDAEHTEDVQSAS
jgi:hypothetical protein